MRAFLGIIVALWLLAASHAPARAEPVSIALLSALAIEATATSVALTTVALTAAATIGVSYLQTVLNKSKGTEPQAPIGTSSGKLTAGGVEPRRFGVGHYMTAGKLAYANTFGQDGKTPNAFLVQVIDLADLPSTGLVEIWVNGAKVTWDPNAAAGADGIPIPDFTFIGIEHLWVRFYDGRQTAADARLVSLFGTDSERPYTNRRVGFGVPYVVITARTRQEVFASFPQFKFVLAGIPLYDRRHDSTAGGSGAQRLSDTDTWTFTENPAVIRENILRGIKYDGVWQWGGQTVTEAQLPAASWMAAASECDSAVALVGGGTEPQFRAGGEIGYGLLPADVIDEINKSDNGRLAEIGGVYKTRSGAPGAAVFSFTDASILSDQAQTFEPFAGMAAQVNYVTAHYTSAAEGWNIKDAPALADASLETLDGRRLSTDVNYGFVTSGTQVQRLMRAERDTARAWRRHALPMPPDAFVLEPLDVVSWTSPRNGYETKTFDITTADDLPNFNMGLAVKELDPNAYSWTPSVHQKPVIDGTIAILRPAPQPIVAWFADPYTLEIGGRARAAILLGWDADTDDVDGIRFEVRFKDTEEVQLTGEEGARVFEAGQLIVSHNLLAATDYQARGQYRPASPRPALWSDWLDVTTPDTRITQSELSRELDAKVRQAVEQQSRYISDLRGEIGQLSAALGDQVSGLKEEAGRIRMGVGARYGQNSAAVQSAISAIADANQSLAAFMLALTAVFNGNEATATDDLLALVNAAEALVGRIGDLEVGFDANEASIHDESVARANADTAFAGRLSSFLATGPGGTAEGRFRFVTSSAPAGAIVSIALQGNVAASGAPNWQPSGIYIDIMSGFSRIRLDASLIEMRDPGINGGEPFPMFSIGGGEALFNVLLRAARIAAGSVTAESIAAGTLVAGHASGDAFVYVRTSAQGAVSPSFPNGATTTSVIQQRYATIAAGNELLVIGSIDAALFPDYADDKISLEVFVDSVHQGTIASVIKNGTQAPPFGFSGAVAVPAGLSVGDHLVQLVVRYIAIAASGNPPRGMTVASSSITVVEARNPRGTG
jgi:Putative phage tail protein